MQSQMLPVLMHPCLSLVSCFADVKANNAPILCFVIAAPLIYVPTDSQEFTVHEQMNIIITCSASGFPAPTLSFFRGTEMITNSGRIQLVGEKISVGTGGLSTVSVSSTLSNAEDADSGEFSCVASADIPVIGSLADAVKFNVTVLGKNKINRVCILTLLHARASDWAKCT